MRVGSLCTGYGGLDLAVEAFYGAETVWTCEYDKHASKVIEARIGKPNHGDLKSTDWTQVEPIDILTAGYPCQPFSHAGLRKGVEDERHLWPYIKEIIRVLRPRIIVLENVRGHFTLGFREVLSDLTDIGYDARWTLIRAFDVGAPHKRERLFILAYPSGSRFEKPERELESNINDEFCEGTITHADFFKRGVSFPYEITDRRVPTPLDQGKLNVKFVEYMMGLPEGWVTDIDISRVQKLKILGNGVVPQQAYKALEVLNSYPQKLSPGYPHA